MRHRHLRLGETIVWFRNTFQLPIYRNLDHFLMSISADLLSDCPLQSIVINLLDLAHRIISQPLCSVLFLFLWLCSPQLFTIINDSSELYVLAPHALIVVAIMIIIFFMICNRFTSRRYTTSKALRTAKGTLLSRLDKRFGCPATILWPAEYTLRI